jgi:hypothetical protein
MDYRDIITIEPGKRSGKPCIRGMRITVQDVLEYLASDHRSLLLNYFAAKRQFSSGVVEGLNAKVKLTLKRSYGFRTENAREVALYHALAKLPEPVFTHSFF